MPPLIKQHYSGSTVDAREDGNAGPDRSARLAGLILRGPRLPVPSLRIPAAVGTFFIVLGGQI